MCSVRLFPAVAPFTPYDDPVGKAASNAMCNERGKEVPSQWSDDALSALGIHHPMWLPIDVTLLRRRDGRSPPLPWSRSVPSDAPADDTDPIVELLLTLPSSGATLMLGLIPNMPNAYVSLLPAPLRVDGHAGVVPVVAPEWQRCERR